MTGRNKRFGVEGSEKIKSLIETPGGFVFGIDNHGGGCHLLWPHGGVFGCS
jgi:hypothetical protein